MLRGIFDVLTKPAMRHEWRWRALCKVKTWLMPNYRLAWPHLLWWEDEEFNAYLARFNELHGFNSDKRWMLYQLALMSNEVPGDTAECGAYQGAGSYLICKATQKGSPARTHFIFDSFEGLSTPAPCDGDYWHEGDLRCSLQNFQHPDGNVIIHKGWIPDRFPDVKDRLFSFVHIDVDLHKPTADSMEFFYPRMSPGGMILLDDYGFTSCPGTKKAVDDFMQDKPEKITMLSCGSGLLIRREPSPTNTNHVSSGGSTSKNGTA